jgi:hypothetical protein
MTSNGKPAFPLQAWEIQTIEALSFEALEKAGRHEFVRYPERFRETFVADLQRDALKETGVRFQIARAADRLSIGIRHPRPVAEVLELDYEVASKDVSARWCRIIGLVLSVDREHEWRALHRELVTEPLMEARQTKDGWKVPDEGLGILQVLEDEAKRHGLINDDPAPEVDTASLAERLLASIGG